MPVGARFIPARIGENKKMTEHKKLQPEIRFAGFTDDWEQRKLEEFSKTTIGEFVIKTKQNPNSKYPVYNGGVSYTGFYDDFNNNGHKIIVSARGANAGFINIINGKYWAGNSCYSIDIQDNYCIEYVYHFMKHKQHLFTDFQQAANIPSVSKKDVEEFLISYPKSKEEQTQIGNFFKQLDDTIALHQRELEKFKILKTSYLENIFLDKVSLFTAKNTITWEQRKLGEVVERITRKNLNLESRLPLTISAQDGLISQTEFFDKQVASKNISGYYLIENGEFAYNKSYSNGYPWGAIKRLDKYKNGVLSTLYIVFKPIDVDSQFLVSYFDTTFWHSEIAEIAVEGARNHGLLNIPVMDFFRIKIKIPKSKEEQTQIGNFFKQLDDTIALHQKELAKYQQIKTACLEKMFVE